MLLTLFLLAIALSGIIGLLIKVAIFCVVIWAIFALMQWAATKGFVVPEPVRIILIAIVCIILIIFVADALMSVL